MPAFARAAVLDRAGGTFKVERFPVPEIAAGQMLLHTELNGVCATDTHIYKGEIPWVPYPVVMGHEFVGTVEQARDVTEDSVGRAVRVGDRIVPMAATPCGACFGCTMKPSPDFLCEHYDLIGFSNADEVQLYGGLSEVVHLKHPRLRFFKTELPAAVAVLTEPFATPVHGVERVGIEPGDQVLVQGSGTVGILAIAAALHAGAGRVIVIGGPARRLEIARAFGAAVTIDIAEVRDGKERVRLVREATSGGRGVDVAIECAGVGSAVIEGIECLRNGGRYAELGHFSDVGEVPINPWRHMLSNNITLIGSSGYMAKHFRRALDILERGAFPFELLVTHRLPLERTREGMLALTPEGGWHVDGEPAAKITIDPSR